MMYPVKEAIENFSGLGGFGLYGIILISSFIIGNYPLAIRLFIALVIMYAITIFVRYFYFKDRPEPRKYDNIISRIDASSFPSLHSGRAAALALLSGLASQNIILTAFLILIAIVVAATRVILKKHDIIDVSSGVLLGIASAAAAIAIHISF